MKMRTRYFIIVFVIFIIFGIIIMNSMEEVKSLDLVKGKNLIRFNITEPFYASTLIELNPEIEVISFVEDNKSYGYVNVFGGIGENLIILSNTPYEIIVEKNISLVIPYDN